MSRYLAIAGVQMHIKSGVDNTQAMLKRLNNVARWFPWVDIVVFSELCASGLNPEYAQPISNESLGVFCRWAHDQGKWLIPGSFYEKQDGKLYNTAVVISPRGQIEAKYRKLFPWAPLEQTNGGNEFCVFDIPGKGRFGICICYDMWFPEVVRNLAWLGAEAVFCPTGTYTSDRDQEIILTRASAISNQLYVFNINGVGAGGIGRSIFVDPEGRVLQESGESEIILTEIIDLDTVARVRENGTLGLCQVWKNLRNFKVAFPMYGKEMHRGEIFRRLGPLTLLHRSRCDVTSGE